MLLISAASAEDAYNAARVLKDCKDAWCALKASAQLGLYVAPIPTGFAGRAVIKLGSKRLAREAAKAGEEAVETTGRA